MVEMGMGRKDPEMMFSILTSKDRTVAGVTALHTDYSCESSLLTYLEKADASWVFRKIHGKSSAPSPSEKFLNLLKFYNLSTLMIKGISF
jgi:hypothetical protein